MAERYQIISHNENRMYQADCPVICCAYNVLLDTVTNDLLFQAKFQNLHQKTVRELNLSVDCYDVSSTLLSSNVELSYIINDGGNRKTFGSDNAKNLPNNKSRKIKLKISSIVFDDGSIWNCENTEYMEYLPQQKKTSEQLQSAELTKEYESLTPDIKGERKWPVFENGYWLCSCGEINLNADSVCHSCKTEKQKLMHISDTAFLSANIVSKKEKYLDEEYEKGISYFNNKKYKQAKIHFENCVDWKDARIYIEKCNDGKKTKHKKTRTIIRIFVTLLILMFIGYLKYFKPMSIYNNALSLLEEKKYKEAYTLLIDIRDFKDVNSVMDECTIEWAKYIADNKLTDGLSAFVGCIQLDKNDYEDFYIFIKNGLLDVTINYDESHRKEFNIYYTYLNILPETYKDVQLLKQSIDAWKNVINYSKNISDFNNNVQDILYLWDIESVRPVLNYAKNMLWQRNNINYSGYSMGYKKTEWDKMTIEDILNLK